MCCCIGRVFKLHVSLFQICVRLTSPPSIKENTKQQLFNGLHPGLFPSQQTTISYHSSVLWQTVCTGSNLPLQCGFDILSNKEKIGWQINISGFVKYSFLRSEYELTQVITYYQHEWDVFSFYFPLYGFDFVCEWGDLSSQIHNPDVHCLTLKLRLLPHCINPSSLICLQELVKLLKLLFYRLLSLLGLELRRDTFLTNTEYMVCFWLLL